MNRRKFIKISSIGIAAFGCGFGAGSLMERYHKPQENFSVFAFLPDDKGSIIKCLKLFQNKINNSAFRQFVQRKNLAEIINKKFPSTGNISTIFTENYYDIKLIQLDQKVRGDIFISDGLKIFLDPSIDFKSDLLEFRTVINKKLSSYLLSVELKEKKLLPAFNSASRKLIKIENHSGLFDKISASENYSSIIVPGSIGKTEMSINDGKVKIKSSPCKHKLCRIMAELSGSNTIACVPNKVLITLS